MAVTTADIKAVQHDAKLLADNYLLRLDTSLAQLTSASIGTINSTPEAVPSTIQPWTITATNSPAPPQSPTLPNAPVIPTSISTALSNVPSITAISLPAAPTATAITIDTSALTNVATNTVNAPQLQQVVLPIRPVLFPVDGITQALGNKPTLDVVPSVSAPVLSAVADPTFLSTTPLTPFVPNITTIGTASSITSALANLVPPSPPLGFVPDVFTPDALETALKGTITKGLSGNGFATSQETALISQAAGAMADEIAAASNRAARDLAARGFKAPTGLLLAAQRKAAKEARRSFTEAYVNVLANESKMNREDASTALNVGYDYINMLRQFYLSLVDVAYRAWAAVADFSFKVYQAEVARATAADEFERIRLAYGGYELEIEKMKLEVAKFQIEENRYVIEANKNILAVYEAQVGVQRLKVDLFNAQLSAHANIIQRNAQLLDAYKTEISAAATVLDVNKNLIAAYRAEVEAAMSVNDINKSNISLYSSQIEANKQQVSLAVAQTEASWKAAEMQNKLDIGAVDIYKATVSAEEARVSAEATAARATIERNRAAIDADRAKTDLYRLQLTAHEATVSNLLGAYKVEASAYAAALQEASRVDTVHANNARAAIDVAKANAQLGIEATRANIERALRIGQMTTEQLKAVSDISAQVASAAMSGQQTMLELSSKVFA